MENAGWGGKVWHSHGALLLGNDIKETRVVLTSFGFAELLEWALCKRNRKSAVITFREHFFLSLKLKVC